MDTKQKPKSNPVGMECVFVHTCVYVCGPTRDIQCPENRHNSAHLRKNRRKVITTPPIPLYSITFVLELHSTLSKTTGVGLAAAWRKVTMWVKAKVRVLPQFGQAALL